MTAADALANEVRERWAKDLQLAGQDVETAILEIARIAYVEKRADLNADDWEVARVVQTLAGLCMARERLMGVQTQVE